MTSHGRVVGAFLSAEELANHEALKRRASEVLRVGELWMTKRWPRSRQQSTASSRNELAEAASGPRCPLKLLVERRGRPRRGRRQQGQALRDRRRRAYRCGGSDPDHRRADHAQPANRSFDVARDSPADMQGPRSGRRAVLAAPRRTQPFRLAGFRSAPEAGRPHRLRHAAARAVRRVEARDTGPAAGEKGTGGGEGRIGAWGGSLSQRRAAAIANIKRCHLAPHHAKHGGVRVQLIRELPGERGRASSRTGSGEGGLKQNWQFCFTQ